MLRMRLVFSKTGRAVYISHLDLMRTFQRAFARAGMQVWHTEGFNPHIYLSIAQPLPVGVAGENELLDFETELKQDTASLPGSLNAVLPEGIRALSCREAGAPFKKIEYAEYEIIFHCEAGKADTVPGLNALFEKDELYVNKKTKSGYKDVDIRPLIKSCRFSEREEGQSLLCRCVLAAGGSLLSPVYITAAVRAHLPEWEPELAEYIRKGFLSSDDSRFE